MAALGRPIAGSARTRNKDIKISLCPLHGCSGSGRILDQALAEAGIARKDTFVTNAVKHFKFEMRGKRRLHKRPNAYEIERCRWWLEQERAIVKPLAIVALGATAARSLFGRVVTITSMRGKPHKLADGTMAFVTIHPLVPAADPGGGR